MQRIEQLKCEFSCDFFLHCDNMKLEQKEKQLHFGQMCIAAHSEKIVLFFLSKIVSSYHNVRYHKKKIHILNFQFF